MANRDPARIAETLRGVAAGTTMFRISEGQARTISAGILLAAADVADMVAERDATIAALRAERDRAMQACEQIGAHLTRLRAGITAAVEGRYEMLRVNRNGHCAHGAWRACTACLDAHLSALLLKPEKKEQA